MTRRVVPLVGSWAVALLGVVATASAQATTPWPAELPPRPLPAHEVTFPAYEIRTLVNELRVIVVPHHEQPAVAIRLLVRAGSAQDPAQRSGVAYLTARLLDQGTKTRSAEQIADEIDSLGGLMATGAAADMTFANVIVMKDSFAVGMAMLYDIVHDPAFAPDEIERQKQRAVSSLQVSSGDPGYVADHVIDRLVYGAHPYGGPGTGTLDTLPAITRDDLVAFHRRYFAPNNMILAVVGDVTPADAFAMAGRVFGGWTAAPGLASVRPAPAVPATRRLVVVDKPDAVQTEIRVGQRAIPRKHPDYVAWDMAVKILGGEGANRLHRVLRSERGLTYGASASVQALQDAGDYVAETDTRTETTGEALRLMVEEFSRLQRQRVFERELADAQAYLTGSFPLTIETPNQIATQVLNTVFYDLPVADLATYRERVLAVTPDDVLRVARQYIHPDRLAIVLVGNARAFLPQLQAVGFSDVEVIPIAQLDLTSATLRRATPRVAGGSPVPQAPMAAYLPPQVNPGAAGESPARTLLRAVIDAKGGLAALQGVRTLVADGEMLLDNGRNETARTRTTVAYPNRFRSDTGDARAATAVSFDGTTGWIRDPYGVQAVTGAALAEMRASAARDLVSLLLNAEAGRVSVRRLPAPAGSPAVAALEFSGPDVDRVQIHVDAMNRIVRLIYPTTDGRGNTVRGEDVFSDFRSEGGLAIAYQTDVLRNGTHVLRRRLTAVTVNGPIDPGLFTTPQR